MSLTDTYKTIETPSEGIYKEKGSKFLAYAFPIMGEESAKEHIQNLKQKYYDARHHCFAWKLGMDENLFRVNDDGEPSGTAGKPIFGQIKSHELTNILIVVVRYFGGIKLGTSGLINAYKAASADVIANATIIERTVNDYFDISFSYLAMNDVMKVIKEENPEIISQQFNLNCIIRLSMRCSKSQALTSRLENIESVGIEHLYMR